MEDPLHEQFTYFEMSKKLLSLIYNPVYDAVVILKRKKRTPYCFSRNPLLNYMNHSEMNEIYLLLRKIT